MSIDDLLKLDPSEFKADVLEPHVIEHIVQESVQEAKEQDWLSLLKMEVKQLRKQYDVSCQTYPLRLLIRLTDNCKYLYFHPRFPGNSIFCLYLYILPIVIIIYFETNIRTISLP